MGYKTEYFVGKVDEDLICSICHEVLKDPYQCKTGHTFCRECIMTCLETHQICPFGKDVLQVEDLIQSLIAKRLIENFEVYCHPPESSCEKLAFSCDEGEYPITDETNCHWTGKLEILEKHRETCPFQQVQCTNANCENYMQRRMSEEHDKVCQFKKVKCENCSLSLARHQVVNHQATDCPEVLIPCPNKCTSLQGQINVLKRKYTNSHISNTCAKTILDCPYNEHGCPAQVERQDIDNHVQGNMAAHMMLLAGQCSFLTERNSSLSEQNLSLTEHCWALDRKVSSLAEQNTSLTEHCSALDKKLSSLTEQNLSLTEHCSALNRKLPSLAEQNSSLTEHCSALDKKISSLTEQNSSFIEHFSVIDKKLSSLTEQNSSLAEKNSSLTEHCSALDRKLSLLTEQNSSFTEHFSVLDKKLFSLTEKNSSLAKQNLLLTEHCSALDIKLSSLSEQCSSLTKQSLNLTSQCSSLTQQCALLNEQSSSNTKQCSSLTTQCASLTRQCASLFQENKQLEEDKELSRTFIWNINNRMLVVPCIRSPTFYLCGYSWYLKLYPQGENYEDKGFVSVLLYLEQRCTSKEYDGRMIYRKDVTCRLSKQRCDCDSDEISSEKTHVFVEPLYFNEPLKWAQFIKSHTLQKHQEIIIKCKIQVNTNKE